MKGAGSESVGVKIRLIRLSRGYTIQQLARRSRLYTCYLSLLERTLFLTYADTGVRPSEGLALRWEDFDVAARTLTVERAVEPGAVGPTKTDTARVVDLTPRLADALNQPLEDLQDLGDDDEDLEEDVEE